jgi:hypothetical protein
MGRAIRSYATSLGADGKYNETITVAFMAIVNARMHQQNHVDDWPTFAANNPDLMAGGQVLTSHYSKELLTSDLARAVFLLPGWTTEDVAA